MASTAVPQTGITSSKDAQWFKHDIEEINPTFGLIMEEYSKIPLEEVKSHILNIREKAWKMFPYPCIGGFNFLSLSVTCHACYPRVLSTLSAPGSKAKLLDIGCCFAQDIRKLVSDGAVAENLYACDLESGFIDLGYDLFADRDTLDSHLFAADIFEESGKLSEIEGMFDFIHVGSFLHLFTQEDQIRACKRIVKLVKPHEGSTVFGRQLGNIKASEIPNFFQGRAMVLHDPRTFEHMWQVVGEETGTKWNVRVELDSEEGMNERHWSSEGTRRLKFEVTRLS
ncbi:MAG: hypothetical protein Q9195_008469 [Heterodermia aff. obscurata]